MSPSSGEEHGQRNSGKKKDLLLATNPAPPGVPDALQAEQAE
jgi:hypothetical protein